MINKALLRAIEEAPKGVAGWVTLVPTSIIEVWGVAARWSESSDPVWAYGSHGWFPTGRTVASYRHRAWEAFIEWLADEFNEDTVEMMAEAAVGFHDRRLDDE